jgi:superoxide dismutase, Cu-Zn family
MTGLPAGLHGIHIHQFGNLSDGCTSAGAHFNPLNQNHGGPDSTVRHVGDLGNIESNGVATPAVINTYDHLVTLSGTNNVIGRSVVIHADPDDLGLGGQSDSLTTGHAGARVACGVIGQCAPFDVPTV